MGSPVLALYLLKTGEWRTDWRGRFGNTEILPPDSRKTVLLHGVSVGEVGAARTLVKLLSEESQLRVVISSTTNTGVSRAQGLFGEDHRVVRFPLDFSWMVRRFLDAIQPDALVLTELELWPNLLAECKRRHRRVCVVNGRLTETSQRNYSRLGRLFRPMFRGLSAVGVQSEEYARRFVALGVPENRVHITDTMKWDNIEVGASIAGSSELAAALGIDSGRPLIVAGSTGPGEERMLLATRPSKAQLLLAPRKPERFDEVARLAPGLVRRTERPDDGTPVPEGHDVFLLDTIGELDKAYALADVVLIGRSFTPMGGSDPIPPIALGRPTIIGPNYRNFRHVVEGLAEGEGLIISDEPMNTAQELLDDPGRAALIADRGQNVIRAHQGGSRRSADLVLSLLS